MANFFIKRPIFAIVVALVAYVLYGFVVVWGV